MEYVLQLSEYMDYNKMFSDQDKGVQARREFDLDYLDREEDAIVYVIIPDKTYSIGSSFFLKMFGESIKTLGEEGFRKKYVFVHENRYPLIGDLQKEVADRIHFAVIMSQDDEDWEKRHRHQYYKRRMKSITRVYLFFGVPVIVVLIILTLLRPFFT